MKGGVVRTDTFGLVVMGSFHCGGLTLVNYPTGVTNCLFLALTHTML